MEDENTVPMIDKVERALQDKLSRAEIEKEFEEFTLGYGIPPGEAARALIYKHGGDPSALSQRRSEEVSQLADLRTDMRAVNVQGRVMDLREASVRSRGEERQVVKGRLADGSGSVPFTSWVSLEAEDGQTLRLEDAFTTSWRGRVHINVGNRSRVMEIDPSVIPEISDRELAQSIPLSQIMEGPGEITVRGRLEGLGDRELTVDGNPRRVEVGIIRDNTAGVPFTAWVDLGVEEGTAVELSGVRVKKWRGLPEVQINSNTMIREISQDMVDSRPSKDSTMRLSDVLDNGGAYDISVRGTVLEVRQGSGLVFRCPDCSRVMKKGVCSIHGKGEGQPDLRIKAVLDDGTGAVSVILNRQHTERFLGKDLERCLALARDKGDVSVIERELRKLLETRELELRGIIRTDDFGPMMVPRQADFSHQELGDMVNMINSRMEAIQ